MSFEDEFPLLTNALNLVMPNQSEEHANSSLNTVIESLVERLGFADLFEYIATFVDNKRAFSEFEDTAVGFGDTLMEGLDSITSEDEDILKGVVLTFFRKMNPELLAIFMDCAIIDLAQRSEKALEHSFLASQIVDLFCRIQAQYPDKERAMLARLNQAHQEFQEQAKNVMTIMGCFEDLEHSRDSEIGRKMLKAIADLAELRYQTYARLLNDLFTIIGRLKPSVEHRPAFGVCADRVQLVVEKDYPEYAYLFDKDFVKIRNAVAHSGTKLVTTCPPTFELSNRNQAGREWTVELTNKAIRWRWEEIDDAVGINGYVPVAISAMCGRTLLKLRAELRALIRQDLNKAWPHLQALLLQE